MINRKWISAVTVVLAGLAMDGLASRAVAADSVPNPLHVYYVGNSVTDTIGYKNVEDMAAMRKQKIIWGRQMIPGAPLSWIWGRQDQGVSEPPFGNAQKALAEFQWDVISLQPFDRRLHDTSKSGAPDGDVEVCLLYMDLAAKKSPDAQVYIYSRWPRITKQGRGFDFDKNAFNPTTGRVDLAKLGEVDDYSDRWNTKWKGGYDLTNETQDYFERLVKEIREKPSGLKKPVLIVPVGDVLNELHQMMKAGKVPGYKSIYEVYADSIHLNNVGRFIVGTTYYATLLKQDPAGIPATAYKVDNPELAKTIQKVVWKVVSEHPYAGVSKGK